ncbi:TRAF-like family protein [Striga hermonthica]|uniref:TRAF-like family protein n=1 Tax=Striga hermonthica TaxID=68872 RepID=A0A9N7RJG6_STRHE|nr:TRAF-like family protein [Striga hermonthica]
MDFTAATDATVIMETREASPAHLLIKIKSFSLFEKHGIKKFKTSEFESGGYKWKLKIYPNGRDRDEGYVSLYLAIVDDGLPAGWEVNAVFTICLFNQISCNYRYSLGISRRFLAMKREWGFSKFISKKELNDPQNGYLSHDDNCVFGAEVFVKENKAVIDCLSLKNVVDAPFKKEWNIPNFSTLGSEWYSPKFSGGGYEWIIELHTNGYGEDSGRFLSLFINYMPKNGNNERLHTFFTLRMKNQLSNEHHERVYSHWFSAAEEVNWGLPSFIELDVLNDPNKGFIVNDCCIIEVEISVQAIASSV